MARRTPYVADGMLHFADLRDDSAIEVDSASWVAWLTDPATRSFSFQSPSGRYTARKEHRSRGGEYWVAYRKRVGKLHKTYLGKAEDFTLERLEDVAATMAGRGGEVIASPLSDAPASDAGRLSRRLLVGLVSAVEQWRSEVPQVVRAHHPACNRARHSTEIEPSSTLCGRQVFQ